jgi:hypothetical protein
MLPASAVRQDAATCTFFCTVFILVLPNKRNKTKLANLSGRRGSISFVFACDNALTTTAFYADPQIGGQTPRVQEIRSLGVMDDYNHYKFETVAYLIWYIHEINLKTATSVASCLRFISNLRCRYLEW